MLGGARRVSMAEQLIRSGKRMGADVKIISYELDRDVPIAIIAEVIEGLKWRDPGVVDDICRICHEKNVDIILPFVDGAIEIAAKCKNLLPDTFVPVIDPGMAEMMFDKVEAAKLFEEGGFEIPQTYTAINAEMPAIAKPRHGSASRGIKIFNNIDDLMHLENLQDYLVQEYIEHNEEYTIDCYISQEGEILVTVPRKRLEVMGGEVTRTITLREEDLICRSRKILNHFGFTGPVTLQFLKDTDADRYLLMEINPRLGGGVICSIYAGAPICDYILREALDMSVSPADDWISGTLMARYQKEAIFFK